MINAISAADIADIAFIMSSSTSGWLLSPLECSPQKQNGWTLRFCFWGWIMWKMYNKTIIEFGFRMISWMIKPSCLCYLPVLNIHDIMLNLIQYFIITFYCSKTDHKQALRCTKRIYDNKVHNENCNFPIVIGLKYSFFPLIQLPSCHRTLCYWTPCYRTVQ